MTVPAAQGLSLGFVPGDHVCAFYSSSRNVLDDIVVDYITKGLQAGNKVFCMVDEPAAVHGRVPPQLVAREGMLNVLTEDEAYMPDGSFSKDVFIRNMETMAREASADGYGSFRAVGDESFIIRNGVDIDGDTVMHVLKTHPRVYVNGIIIGNPHYQADPLPG